MLWTYWLLVTGAVCLAHIVHVVVKHLSSPTRSIPGPFWARFTKLWYFSKVAAGNFQYENIQLHRRYGPVVRLAPGMYSIDIPEAMNQVYGIGSKMPKGEWYDAWKHPSPDRWTVFQDRDVKRPSETRKRFQGLYSLSSLVNYEGYVDQCSSIFQKRLDEFSETEDIINMTNWFQYYAFDVIGDITYSERFGFMEQKTENAWLLRALEESIAYSTLVGIYVSLHPVLFFLSNWLRIGGALGRNQLFEYAARRVKLRQEARALSETKGGADVDGNNGMPQDFLDKLLIQHDENPTKVTTYHIFMMGLANVAAGSDTTAISLSAILYYLLKSPTALGALQSEVDEMTSKLKGEPLSFKDTMGLPYLQAVIKEALRLHSATGLPLWRVVPEGGMTIGGVFFPAGSTVGLNTWCAHYNQQVFGPDAAEFRPERWLTESKEELTRMNSYYLPFGHGTRTCLGRHISQLEMSKLIPHLVQGFDFELVNTKDEWKLRNHWFVRPLDFYVKVKKRNRD